MSTLTDALAAMRDGDTLDLTIDAQHFDVTYSTAAAYGDDGRPVAGDVTGFYVLRRFDVDGVARTLSSYHVGPHGTSDYGNPASKRYVAERVAAAVQAHLPS